MLRYLTSQSYQAQVKVYEWFWPLDTNAATFPFGFPRAPGLAFSPEFFLAVARDGIEYTAFLVDRRPTLSGGVHVITPVVFSVGGRDGDGGC